MAGGRVRKSAEERKSEIAEAALRLADEVGPGRLSTEQVARSVGVTQAAIFRHFPRKQDLWEAVAAHIGEVSRRRWLAAEREAADPLDRLRRLVLAQLALIRSTPAIPTILFSRELHVENQLLRTLLTEVMRQFLRRVARFVEEGQRAGRLRGDVAAEDAALLIIGMVQGLVLRWSLNGRAFDLAAEGERLLDVQLRCLGAPTNDNDDRSTP